ncbi:MAG: hypothetical protein Q7U73_21285 [Rubrivivax sp.]|nr:hypothetical protein [Rubrivivax sp.]
MVTLNIQTTDATGAGVVVEIWERGSGGQADVQVETRTLADGQPAAGLAVGATRYLVVREASDSDAKTIDNWSQTPPAPGDA